MTRLLRDALLRAEQPTPGGVVLVACALGNIVLWFAARPPHEPTGRFIGEVCGAEAVLLFSCTLVLATLLPRSSRVSGLDRIVVWHRRTAVAEVLLLIPHVALATSAPDRYATGIGPGLGDLALLGRSSVGLGSRAQHARRPVARSDPQAGQDYVRTLAYTASIGGIFLAAAVAHGAVVDQVLHHSTLLRVVYLIVGGVGVAACLYRKICRR